MHFYFMKPEEVIKKIQESGLTGRSGSGFPTGKKWEMIKEAKSDKKYIICNAAEGEPGSFKDKYILENYPQELVEGIRTAINTIKGASQTEIQAYIYLKKEYYEKFKKPLERIIKNSPIKLFEKPHRYIAGEETCACNVIEGKRIEPREKPPYPTESGLWEYPTLINNVETLFSVTKILNEEFNNTRFYSISGDVKHEGVYELSVDCSAEKLLKETGNYPNFDFFIQSGGGATGEIVLPQELDKPVKGIGAVIVYNRKKTDPYWLMKKWANFFSKENCNKCTPCREGTYRLLEMFNEKNVDKKKFEDLVFVLEQTSFCAFGKSLTTPFKQTIKKLL